ncbi:MAG: nucleotide exchange factor GrpE [Magnetococcales bacterium]|nr:nucleotide exchange factor GrpE [Magnetococcales bacterium]MBF0115264.1 nucleotide exchange factor GrpE [Magnetococcales bacterium]
MSSKNEASMPETEESVTGQEKPTEQEAQASASEEVVAQVADAEIEEAVSRLFNEASTAASATVETGPDLEKQLQSALAQVEEQRGAHLRAVAEMQNVRKRFERESQQARQFAIEGFARDLLQVADNLERAMGAVPKECSADLKAFLEGVGMTQNELVRVLGKHGVARVKALHEPFDHNVHQAVMEVASAELPAGHVAQELQAGYLLNGRLLRAAMVGVAKAAE